jgi:ketosteroid isomerase-like protein
MPHPHEPILRSAYVAFAKGDIPAFLDLCTPDITFRVPGAGMLGGYHKKDQFLAKLGPAMGAVGGTFREEVVRIATSDDGGAVFAHQQAARDGTMHQWNAVHWWRIQNGKLAEFHEFVDDPAAFERAWHR